MIVLAAQLAAGVALLLWSVRMIRTGMERAFLSYMKRGLRVLSRRRLTAASGGMLVAILMQSSTAVALIVAGFVVSGLLGPATALSLLLGAELGSALMAKVLLFPIGAIIPFVLVAGVTIFLRAGNRKTKQSGRILVGFALVLISLQMIGETSSTIAENSIVQSIAAYFATDLLGAYVLGALVTWAMHSSLVAVLTYASFAAAGVISPMVAGAMVVGANLGGALIPQFLLWTSERPVRVMLLGNLLARGSVSVFFLLLLVNGVIEPKFFSTSPAQQAVMLHIALNAVVLVLALPTVSFLVRAMGMVLPKHAPSVPDDVSALDPEAMDHPPLALSCAQRELLRMAETVQAILVPVLKIFRSWDPETERVIARREDDIDRMHFAVKIYISKLREFHLTEAEGKKTLDIVATANSLEDAGDRIAVNLVALARKLNGGGLAFSEQGLADLEDFHDQIVSNGQLALSVLTTGDAEAARQLVAEKDRIRIEEQRLQEKHLKRLQAGGLASLNTSNIHQETLMLLKQINASLTYVAYPIAEETGHLLSSRLSRTAKIGASE